MRYLPLVLANLGRHKRRTFLTTASVALALFLFASLRTVVTTIAAGAQFGSARRLVATNATGIVFPLPLAYAGRLRALPGVQAVSWANWFGGRYGDGKRFFATFAVDPASYLDMYPEIVLPADEQAAFRRRRWAAIVGRRLLDVFGWHLGQDVTLQGTIFSGDWTFTIRGVYTPSDPVINDDMLKMVPWSVTSWPRCQPNTSSSRLPTMAAERSRRNASRWSAGSTISGYMSRYDAGSTAKVAKKRLPSP